MSKTVAVGIQDFKTLIERNCFYIDKTQFIREWWDGKDDVTLITRPRRFGKTLTMSMLDYFFSNRHADGGSLFEGLQIWQDEKYRGLQGTYPVISLSFAQVKERSYEKTFHSICLILYSVYEEHMKILEGSVLSESQKEEYRDMMAALKGRNDAVMAANAIHMLCRYMGIYYGKKVIILLDEYDTPMQEAYVNGFWEELVAFTRSMFNSAFKTNPYLERAIMMGITRVSRESMFSDLNNLEVVTTTTSKYETAFGFTEQEVFGALDELYRADDAEKQCVKKWYDGFVFGRVGSIYNPWSIINYLGERRLDAYWANTSANSLASKLIREGNTRVKLAFERLLRGETVKSPIDEQIVYSQLDGNEAAILSLLVAAGYLKVLSVRMDPDSLEEREYELALTNHEVRIMFRGMVHGWFSKASGDYNDFIGALLRGDRKAMNAYMNRVALSTFSCFDTGNSPSGAEPERFYHGFVLGLLVELERDYMVKSNRESGFGRYDVVIEPRDPKERDAYILEFKVQDEEDEETLRDTVCAALAQIEERRYAQELISRGIGEGRIHKYGFAFCGKKVLIG